ncbi:MAG: flagellar hook-basal body complex protein [Alphaproteobacteria bacterium]|nr:flagellar hook-basal body complex protein [Alphaproteobacteria bacterium]
MSFYTALTGLNGSQADISASSNNIANVGTTGFKRSRAEFGDIFATSPLQNASSSIGSGTILKGIKQQFTQGNIAASLNALDLAISGQGFFALKPSLTSTQTVYTRNGSLNVNNDRYVVDSAGQYLLVYPVNEDGSVTAKDLDSALPMQLPVTSGDPKATGNIELGVNVPAAAEVVPDKAQFADGYSFNPSNPETYTNSTSITIFDDLGNPTIATIYFIKTQNASAEDPTNKYDTRLVINDTVIDPDLVSAVDDAGNQIYIDRFGAQTTEVPDDNYFLEGKGSPLYKLDDLQSLVDSEPTKVRGQVSTFDFGDEGDKLVEIVTDPVLFNATRESGVADSQVFWGKNFMSIKVDDIDTPVNIDIRPGKYNAEQLATEVSRAINYKFGDDRKFQIVQNVDDTLNFNFYKLLADGTSSGLSNGEIEVDLLSSSFVTDVNGIDLDGASPDFTKEEFLAHAQSRMNDALNEYAVSSADDTVQYASALGVNDKLFARTSGSQMLDVLEATEIVKFKHYSSSLDSPSKFVVTDNTDISADDDINATAADTAIAASYNWTVSDEIYDQGDTFSISIGADNSYTYTANSGDTRNEVVSGLVSLIGTDLDGDFTITTTEDSAGLSNLIVTSDDFDTDFDFSASFSDYLEDTSTNTYYTATSSTTTSSVYNLETDAVASYIIGDQISFSVMNNNVQETISYTVTDDDIGATDAATALAIATAISSDLNPTSFTITQTADSAELTLTSADGTTIEAGATITKSDNSTNDISVADKYMVHSYYGSRPELSVYDSITAVAAADDGQTIEYDGTDTLKIYVNDASGFTQLETIRVAGNFSDDDIDSGADNLINGREFTIASIDTTDNYITISTQGLGFETNAQTLLFTSTDVHVLSDESSNVEAFFEGAENVYEDAPITFNSQKIILREKGASNKHAYTNDDIANITGGNGIFEITNSVFELSQDVDSTATDSIDILGLGNLAQSNTKTVWVDEKNPPLKVNYDALTQKLEFSVDRTVLGTGTDSNFNSFTVFGSDEAQETNNLGIPARDDSTTGLIRGGERILTGTFVASGAEISADKSYGISAQYNSDTKSFTFASGTSGEEIAANGALGVNADQKASFIQVGRTSLTNDEILTSQSSADFLGDNLLIGIGSTADTIFTEGTGLRSEAAISEGATAREDLSEVFRLGTENNENIFNVSVNGINGLIEIPSQFYVGSTLAEALEERINQIVDSNTGETVGGVTVKYNSSTNNFTFTTGTTGSESTIKVKGTARLGLDDVALGVGSVPQIYNLVQATNAQGVALYVDSEGNVVETPPENLVDGYYPLYIDEGELTFDKTGKLVSPKNNVHYEKQEEGFSIALDVDFGQSTQLSQPFSVLSVEQDGFTSGRLDGLEIDASGTIRANYTNGQNNPLGKIVVANFNNQNGLKQIGNATYVETAVSGTPQVGEAGAEGFGNILSGSLERSNVDITEELVNLITAQRNFQASAKAIETTTGLTQTIINIRM